MKVPLKRQISSLLIFTVLLSCIGVAGLSYWYSYRLSHDQKIKLSFVTQEIKREIDTSLEEAKQNFLLLSQKTELADISNSIDGLEVPTITEFLQSTQKGYSRFSYLIVSDLEGRIIGASERGMLGLSSPFNKEREYLNARRGEFQIHLFKANVESIENGFWLHAPIYSSWDKSNPIGVLSGMVPIVTIHHLLENFLIEGDRQNIDKYLILLSNEKSILYSPHFVGKKKKDSFYLPANKEIDIEDEWGTKVTYSSDSVFNYRLVLYIDKNIVFRNINNLGVMLGVSIIVISLLSFIVVSIFANRVINPVKNLIKSTERIKNGDNNVKVESSDILEFDTLANTYNEMVMRLQCTMGDLNQLNNHLEDKVKTRNKELLNILNNVKFGFIVVDENLKIKKGFTRSCVDLFEQDIVEGGNILNYLNLSQKDKEHFTLMIIQVFQDNLPSDLSLNQLPQRIIIGRDNKTLFMEGSVIRNESGSVESILFTISDITELELVQKENELNKVLLEILRQKESFKVFLSETYQHITEAKSLDDENLQGDIKQTLHTIKGNSAIFGLKDISSKIHDIEGFRYITTQHIKEVEMMFIEFLKDYEHVIGMDWSVNCSNTLEISRGALETLNNILTLKKNTSCLTDQLEKWVQDLNQTKVIKLLEPFILQAERLAQKKQKKISFNVIGEDTTVNPILCKPFFQNLIHIIRNSVDHGIEPPWNRGVKPETGLISIEIKSNEEEWEFIYRDDGKGIDTVKLVEKAVKENIISIEKSKTLSFYERLELIYVESLSTLNVATQISGRGAGMCAVKNSIEEVGGTIKVDSSLGKGTTFVITIPKKQNPPHAREKDDSSTAAA